MASPAFPAPFVDRGLAAGLIAGLGVGCLGPCVARVGPSAIIPGLASYWGWVPLFLLVGVTSATFSYFSHGRMVNEFMDTQMEQLGQSLVGHEGDLMPPPLSNERIEKWGMYIVQVWGKDGTLLKTTWPQLQAPLQASSGLANIPAGGLDWRVYLTFAH